MKPALDVFASLSRLAIAAAIAYFAWQLAEINSNVGGVTQTVDRVTVQIPPALAEVREIRLEIAQIREQVPALLAEVEAVRREIPAVVAQVEAVNGQVDPILRRVDRSLDEMAALQRQLPQILASVDAAVAALNQTRDAVVPLVSPALDEIRLTREKIDPTLDRVETLVDDTFVKANRAIAEASQAGQKASEGAVKGFFTGLIKLPFQLVGTLAAPLVKTMDPTVAELLDERDLELMEAAGREAVRTKAIDDEKFWSNPKSGNSGTVTVKRLFSLEGNDCVEARITISNPRKQVHDKTSSFCRDQQDQWLLASEVGKAAPWAPP